MSVVQESMSTDKVLTSKNTRHFSRQARQKIYVHTSRFGTIWINKNMTGWTPKLTQQHMKRTHQRWEACQTIQNTLLCPQFRHNFLQGNLCQRSNIANNRATKQTRSKQQNQIHERRQQIDVTHLLRGDLSKNLHQFLYPSQFFTLNY